MPELPSQPSGSGVGWGMAVLGAVLFVILIALGFGGHGHGWGRDNQLAHMMPPAVGSSADGPATRSGAAGPSRNY
jgi:hypothetical protein